MPAPTMAPARTAMPDMADVTLRPMTQDEFDAYLVVAERDYVADIVRSGGGDVEAAEAKAAKDMDAVRRSGPVGPRHRTFVVVGAEGIHVGDLWLGTGSDWKEAWIFDIRIDAEHRGRGLGRATLAAGEAYARSLGASAIGLHVFAFNDVARTLYETSGYRVVDTRPTGTAMRKRLTGRSAKAT